MIKPILFNTDMVRAILDGRKTVTRRLIKPQPKFNLCFTFAGKANGTFGYPDKNVYKYWGEKFRLPECISDEDMQCRWTPPCHTDDILYVRESWNHYVYDVVGGPEKGLHKEGYFYKASPELRSELPDYVQYHWGEKWKPSIHMPKEAARIFLKVTDVRIERLQEMSEDDAFVEGIKKYSKDGNLYKYAVTDDWWIDYHNKHRKLFTGSWWQDMPRTAKEAFSYLWNSTIKNSELDRYGWDANPYVWVVEFEQCEKPENIIL